MNPFQEIVVKNPPEQGRAADTKRERGERDGYSPVTHKLLFGILRKSVGHRLGN